MSANTAVAMLPDITDPVAGPFWAALGEQRLSAQRCSDCGTIRLPPLSGCPTCLGRGYTWVDLAPTGAIWSFAVYHRVLHAAFEGQVPYTVLVVDLDDGPQLVARLSDDEPKPRIGDRVRAEYHQVAPEVTLVRWRLDPTA